MSDTDETKTYTPPVTPVNVLAHMPANFTLDQLKATFTDDEIAAMQEDDPVLDDVTDADIPEPAKVVKQDAFDDDEPAPVVTAQAPAAVAPQPVADAAPPVPRMIDITPAQTQAEQAAAALAALMDKFDDGDINIEEYRTQQAAIQEQQVAAKAQIMMAEQAYTRDLEGYKAQWYAATGAYHEANPVLTQENVAPLWDAELKSINANPAFANAPFQQRISAAHASLAAKMQALGTPIPGPAAKAPPSGRDLARKDGRPAAPDTLANMPTGDLANEDGSKLAMIDRVVESGDWQSAERMIAALPSHEREAYRMRD